MLPKTVHQVKSDCVVIEIRFSDDALGARGLALSMQIEDFGLQVRDALGADAKGRSYGLATRPPLSSFPRKRSCVRDFGSASICMAGAAMVSCLQCCDRTAFRTVCRGLTSSSCPDVIRASIPLASRQIREETAWSAGQAHNCPV